MRFKMCLLVENVAPHFGGRYKRSDLRCLTPNAQSVGPGRHWVPWWEASDAPLNITWRAYLQMI